jgi:hypothetical protein
MATELTVRLETPSGDVVGTDPAWKGQRQFLWDVVHDTRGLLRDETLAADLAVLRRIDSEPDAKRKEYAHDAAALRSVVENVWEVARNQPRAPRFRLIAPADREEWSAVNFFEDQGVEYALVGGWTGPLLRVLGPEPDQRAVPDDPEVTFGSHRFRITGIPYADYFRNDFESLLATLRQAESKGLRVRLVQR